MKLFLWDFFALFFKKRLYCDYCLYLYYFNNKKGVVMESTGEVENQELENQEIENKEFIEFLINPSGIDVSDEEIERVFLEYGMSATSVGGGTPEEKENGRKSSLRDWYASLCMEEGASLANKEEKDPYERKKNLKEVFVMFKKALNIRQKACKLHNYNSPFLANTYDCIGIIYFKALDYTNNEENKKKIHDLAMRNYHNALIIQENIQIQEECIRATTQEEKKARELEISKISEHIVRLEEEYTGKKFKPGQFIEIGESWMETEIPVVYMWDLSLYCKKICETFDKFFARRHDGYERVPSSDPDEIQESLGSDEVSEVPDPCEMQKLPNPVVDEQRLKLD